ncbi:hypothetical protein IWW48_001711 [Coemansia sp. RSA 1200]|nr:hypothetical protein IWW48_001711 [Coemansia sp. RSA 1200]
MSNAVEFLPDTAVPAEPAVPEWLELFDPQTSRVVYANTVTGQCSWTRPTSHICPRDPNGEWWELVDEDTGVPYYYNSSTGATEWDTPPDATVIPFHTLLSSSVGKRLSLVVSNRGSMAFNSDQIDALVRKASRASMRSADGRASRKNSMAAAHGANTRRSPESEIETETKTEAADHQPPGPVESNTRSSLAPHRLSQSESALEALHETMAADEIEDEGDDDIGSLSPVVDTRLRSAHLGHHQADYSVPASATIENFPIDDSSRRPRNRSEALRSGSGGGVGTMGAERMSALDYYPAHGAGMGGSSVVMLHAHRNRSMPSIRGDGQACGMRAFASTQFAAQKRGFLRRKVPLDEMVSYTSETIARPLLNLPREMARDAVRAFRTIQRLLGNIGSDSGTDRRAADTLWLANRGIACPPLRDEVFCQLAKQITGNPSAAAAERGWALLAVLLYAFRPSPLLFPHLEAFVGAAPSVSPVPSIDLHRLLRLQLMRARRSGGRTIAMSAAELQLAMAVPSRARVFGAALDDIAADSALVASQTGLPRIVEQLVSLIVSLGGLSTEGLFRIPGDADAVALARLRIEAGSADFAAIDDPNVPASLLKEWMRDLADPLVPESYYARCVAAPDDPDLAREVFAAMSQPALRVVRYLLAFFARLLRPSVRARTKMDASNLALVFGPSLLRNPASDPRDMFANSSNEQRFVLTLIDVFGSES